MVFPSPDVDEFLHELTPPTSELLSEIESKSATENSPIIGPLVGRVLYQLVKISQSKAVFEFGSCFGYSALWIAMALPEEGRIICTEFDKGKVERGRQYFDRAKLSHKVTFEVGDAFESFQRYPGPFDLIFCDLDKRYYPQVLEVAVPKLKSGGLLIADNVLWSGKVLDRHDHSKDTEGIRQFDKGIYCHPELFSSILPVRDGLSVSLKK